MLHGGRRGTARLVLAASQRGDRNAAARRNGVPNAEYARLTVALVRSAGTRRSASSVLTWLAHPATEWWTSWCAGTGPVRGMAVCGRRRRSAVRWPATSPTADRCRRAAGGHDCLSDDPAWSACWPLRRIRCLSQGIVVQCGRPWQLAGHPEHL